MDPGLNQLLQWGITNSDSSREPDQPVAAPPRGMTADALRSLMGGPTDADLMRESMVAISSPESSLEDKIVAFDNFEQLIENLDNANNMEPMGLWTPLIKQFDSPHADMRRMAAWCVGTAVQNNVKSQERFLAMNGVEKLCSLAVEDKDKAVRKKAVYALSSEVRNYQPGANELVRFLPKEFVQAETLDCEDMDAIDVIMAKLRER